MRSKKELYQLVLDKFKKRILDRPFSFICVNIIYLHEDNIITKDEYLYILNDFKLNRPNKEQHSEFMNEFWVGDGGVWWNVDKDSSITRIKFLEKLIENN